MTNKESCCIACCEGISRPESFFCSFNCEEIWVNGKPCAGRGDVSDTTLLDFMDKDIQYQASEDGYGGLELDYCYWQIQGQCNDIRTAIRKEMEYRKNKSDFSTELGDLPF